MIEKSRQTDRQRGREETKPGKRSEIIQVGIKRDGEQSQTLKACVYPSHPSPLCFFLSLLWLLLSSLCTKREREGIVSVGTGQEYK